MKVWARRSPYEKAEPGDRKSSRSGRASIEETVASVDTIVQKTEYRRSLPLSEVTFLVMTWTSILKPRYDLQDCVFTDCPFLGNDRRRAGQPAGAPPHLDLRSPAYFGNHSRDK